MEQIEQTKGRYTLNISMIELVMLMFKDWIWYGVFCFVAACIGVGIAFSIPKYYTSAIKLAPEEAQSALGGNVSSLASMVGLDMKLGTNDAIYPEIYPEIIRSSEFLVGLFEIPVTTGLSNNAGPDGEPLNVDYRTYLAKHQKISWWTVPINWVVKKINEKKNIAKRPEGVPVDPSRLTVEEDALVRAINKSIDCQVDKKTDVISISVDAQDPLVAKAVVDTVTSRLQYYITDYRTRKARADLAYIEQIYDEAKRQYDAARENYAITSNSHQDVIMETARSMVKALENEMQLKYTIFTQVAEQRQLARANVQKMTPAFTVINNSTVPVKHSNTPKIVIVAIFAFLGFVIRTIVLIFKNKKLFLQKT